MERENMNHNADPASGQGTGGNVFTQEQVNTIIQDRLAKEKAKYEKQISDMQTDIKRREKLLEAKEKLGEKGLPVELADLVRLDDDNSFNASLELLERTYKQDKPQGLQDGGNRVHGYKPKGGTHVLVDPVREAMGLDDY